MTELLPVDYLLLIGELEGVHHKTSAYGFTKDAEIIDNMKKRYYKLYFKAKKQADKPTN